MAEPKYIETHKHFFLYELKSNKPGISFIQYKEDNRNPHSFRAFAELDEFSFQTDSAAERKEAIEAVKKYLDNR
jgi:hypothetical protein